MTSLLTWNGEGRVVRVGAVFLAGEVVDVEAVPLHLAGYCNNRKSM